LPAARAGSTLIPQIGSIAIDTPLHILSLNGADARPPIEMVAISH